MRVLTLSYPLTPVAEGACGGTEQVAGTLLRALRNEPEIELDWIAAEGSDAGFTGVPYRGWGALLKQHGLARPEPELYTPEGLEDLQRRCNEAVIREVSARAPDLIHNQGGFFGPEAAHRVSTPVLFTAHLARELYPATWFTGGPANLHLQCVSQTQWTGYRQLACCGVIHNGIEVNQVQARKRRAGRSAPLLYLGRLCPEKGPHLAIDVARRARRTLWLAGSVARFPSHQEYFRSRILPRLGADVRWLPAPTPAQKRALLRAAAAVVIPSQVAETSSLVAMEAAAAGVPALALRVGALPEIVVDGHTGWLSDQVEELGELAASKLELSSRRGGIAPAACREWAERHYSAARMARQYLDLYGRLGAGSATLHR